MEFNSVGATGAIPDFLRNSGRNEDAEDVRERFRNFLQAFEDTAEVRVRDTLSEKITDYGLMGWTARALEMKAYEDARAKVLRHAGVTEDDVAAMTDEEREQIEIRVSSQMREELAQAVKDDAEEKLEAKRRQLFHIVTLPTSE